MSIRKYLTKLLAALLLAGIAVAGLVYWRQRAEAVVSTDDAYVKTDNIVISSKVSGIVAQVVVVDHQAVRVRQLLIRIEAADVEARVEQKQAARESARAALDTLAAQRLAQQHQVDESIAALAMADAQAARSALDHARDQTLFAQGFATIDQVDTGRLASELASLQVWRAQAALAASRTQLAVADARAVSLRADLRQAEAVARSSRLELGDTELVAPADAVVGSRSVEVGQFVRPGMQLLTLVPQNRIHVVANFKETQVAALRPGQVAEVAFDAFPGAVFSALVDSIGPSTGSEFSLLPADNATGNFTKIVQRIPVRLLLTGIDLQERHVRPGMSASVSIDTRQAVAMSPHSLPSPSPPSAATAAVSEP